MIPTNPEEKDNHKAAKQMEQAISKRRNSGAHKACEMVLNLISNPVNANESYNCIPFHIHHIGKSKEVDNAK